MVDEPAVAEEGVAVALVDELVALADEPATPEHPTAAKPAPVPSEDGRPNRRKVREGIVVTNKMDKSIVVVVIERVRHPRYAKTVQRTKRLYVHDGDNAAKVGDRVRVVETRPLSKLKRWRLSEVLERAR